MDRGGLVGHYRQVPDLEFGWRIAVEVEVVLEIVAGVGDRDEVVGLEFVVEPLVTGPVRSHGVAAVVAVEYVEDIDQGIHSRNSGSVAVVVESG